MKAMVGRRGLALAASAIVVVLAWPSYAQATITVNTNADLAAPGGCSGSPGDCSIRRAIDAAFTGEAIIVPADTYRLSLGALGIGKSLSIVGADARTTTVSGDNSSGAFSVGTAGPVLISDLTITAGHLVNSSFLSGGAIFNNTGSVLALDRVAVSGTTLEMTGSAGATRGAGINNRGASLTITNSTISGNLEIAQQPGTGNQGAGLFDSGGDVTITNSTIAGNSQIANNGASSSGSGISNVGGGTVNLRHVTVAGNTGSENIDNSDLVNAKSTIVANGASGNCSGALTSQGHNLESADECGLHGSGDQVNKDPLLGGLVNNGGSTDTMALASSSPAIDAADPGDCPGTDQRGVARPQQGTCDVGAFEFVPGASLAMLLKDLTSPRFLSASVTRRWAVDTGGAVERPVASRRKRKRAPRGARFRYTLSEAARVVFTIERRGKGRRVKGRCRKATRQNRKRRRCIRHRRVGRFAQSGVAGRNSKRFSGRIGRRRLRPGSYRATLVATDPAGNRSKARRLRFKVVRP